MNTDIALTLGVIIAGLSIPSILSTLSDKRAPRASAITVLIGAGLIFYAMTTKPGGYALKDVPEAFVRVVALVLN